jgi:hypothetical protein
MNKPEFDSWVAGKGKKWDALTPDERRERWDTRIRQERLGNEDTMIINRNDPVLKANLPDPLHGTPNIHLFDKVYGRGVWTSAPPVVRYKMWAERVQLERKGEAEPTIIEAEKRDREHKARHKARIAEMEEQRKRDAEDLAAHARELEAKMADKYPPISPSFTTWRSARASTRRTRRTR